MIIRTDQRVLEALMALEHDHHFKDVVQWMADSLEATRNRCMEETDEIALRQAQGAAKDLREFIEAARDARSNLDSIRRQTP